MRILVVDDDDAIRRWLVRQLEPLGYDMMESANGDEGLWQFQQHNFDFVLTDYLFGGRKIKNGLELVARIHEINRDQPMAIHTSERGLKAPVPVLHKPYAIQRLLKVMQRATSMKLPFD
jgi:two-component system, OmpR family, response regulator ArlR